MWFITGAGNKILGKRNQGSSSKMSMLGVNNLPPRKQKKQEIKLYFQEHYQTKVKPLVDAEVNKYTKSKGTPPDKAQKLKLLKKMMKEVFDSEDQTVKDNIALKALNQPSPYPPQQLDGKIVCTPKQFLRYSI